MPPVTLTAEFKIVTPMFIGGADQSPVDGIRPPSVKGALRFWWRALNWGRFCQEGKDKAESLRELHKKESRLFGNASREKNGKQLYGQEQFLLEIAKQPSTNTDSTLPIGRVTTPDLATWLMEFLHPMEAGAVLHNLTGKVSKNRKILFCYCVSIQELPKMIRTPYLPL